MPSQVQTPPQRVRKRDRLRIAGRLTRVIRLVQSTRVHVQAMVRAGEGVPPLPPKTAQEIAEPWARELLRLLGVEVVQSGEPPMQTPGMLVSNHSSYLDILVWLATTGCCFMAKQSVAKAPLIGTGATYIGTVYVERSSGKSRQAVREALGKAVEQGHQVVVFPEGTTSHDNSAWRPGSFQVAVDKGFYVQPAAICYSEQARYAWVDRPFLKHFWDLLRATPARVELHRFAPRLVTDVKTDVPAIHAEVDAWYQAQRRLNP